MNMYNMFWPKSKKDLDIKAATLLLSMLAISEYQSKPPTEAMSIYRKLLLYVIYQCLSKTHLMSILDSINLV